MQCRGLSVSCLCAGLKHPQCRLKHQKVSSIWPSIECFAVGGTFCLPKYIPPHCFQERLLAQIPNISTYVNAFGFDLNSWVGIRVCLFFLGMLFSPFSCIPILLSHPVIVSCCLPFYKLRNVVTQQHTHTHIYFPPPQKNIRNKS